MTTEDEHFNQNTDLFESTEEKKNLQRKEFMKSTLIGLSVAVISIVAIAILVAISLTLSGAFNNLSVKCDAECKYTFVESLPQETNFVSPPGVRKTFEVLEEMISTAQKTIKISAFYWTLNNTAYEAGGELGNRLLKSLYDAKNKTPSIEIDIIQTQPSANFDQMDSFYLKARGIANVVNVDPSKSLGSGVQHAKFLITDNTNFYLGSANMDWRSLSEVKELGIYVQNCPCLADDLSRIFEIMKLYGGELNNTIPIGFPPRYDTNFNIKTPMSIGFPGWNGTEVSKVYLAASPIKIKSPERTSELQSILTTIQNTKQYLNISLMDYYPLFIYGKAPEYWGEIDVAIREAVVRGVAVNMLLSKWNTTSDYLWPGLDSLKSFGAKICPSLKCKGSINIKIIKIPDPTYKPYPFTRVNHCKFLVTNETAFISTSNWSKDYFYSTFGAAFVSQHYTLITQLQSIFNRDWNSNYSVLY